jgi:S1-C subfamily serine protease
MQDSATQLRAEEPPTPEYAHTPTSSYDSAGESADQQGPATIPLETPGVQNAHNAWIPDYTHVPPVPPFGGGGTPPAARPGGPRGHRLTYALLTLALLAALGVGTGIGAAVTHATTTSGSTITIGAQTAPAIAASSSANSLQQTVESVVRAVQPSVVEITSVAGRQEAIGSGEILTTDGYIITNDHVVQGYNSFTVTLSNGSSQTARLVGQDPQDDLAVLKIAATKLQPIALGDSAKAQVGEFAIAVGNPLGLQQSATFGIVSALNRSASEAPSGPAGTLTGLIQTSAPINPGNSGGALVNLQGQLIGIPTLGAIDPQTGAAANGIGYAIPSDRVSFVATQLIQHGQLINTGQGFLGIQAEDVTPALAAANGLSVQSGVLVGGFAQDAAGQSPAQQAGLQTGDIITAVNGQPISGSGALATALLNQSPGTQVTLTIVRGTSQHTLQVTLGERPTTNG